MEIDKTIDGREIFGSQEGFCLLIVCFINPAFLLFLYILI